MAGCEVLLSFPSRDSGGAKMDVGVGEDGNKFSSFFFGVFFGF